MSNPNGIMAQINQRITQLVRVGLADDLFPAFRRRKGRLVEVTFLNAGRVSSALKNVAYETSIVLSQRRERSTSGCSMAP